MACKLPAGTEFDECEALYRWIHSELAESEFAPVLQDARLRLSRSASSMRACLRPLVFHRDDETVAASYFNLLGGDVATLGGARAASGGEQFAVEIIQWQVDKLRRCEVPQIQAIVRQDDVATAELIKLAGFTQLTCIEHQWLDVSAEVSEVTASDSVGERPFSNPMTERRATSNSDPTAERRATLNSIPTTERRATLNWRPAHHFAHKRMAYFIESTFVDTLDCPAMNGRRSRKQVLEGFLDGRPLRQTDPCWQVLEVDGRVAGCLLLQQHSANPSELGLVELVYMGLLTSARGNGLGSALVQRAISTARQLGTQTLVVAVDQQNWPALDVYRQFGFQSHQSLQVWIVD